THGVWVAGTLAERYLANERVPARLARELGKEAADALLGRKVAGNQYSAARKYVEPRAPKLMALILEHYSALVGAEGSRSLEHEPPKADRLAHAKWRAKYRRLLRTLAVSGAEGVAKDALRAIPRGAWPDFSLMAGRKDKPLGTERAKNQRPKRGPRK